VVTDTRAGDIGSFYALLDRLGDLIGGPRRLRDCTASSGWPAGGVYYFFEDGERRDDGSMRVVRVGTHALTAASRTTLWTRLAQHRGTVAGAKPGGGNHRGSIFRHHVGSALLASGEWDPAIKASWTRPHPTRAAREAEHPLERAVSEHIGAMPLLWLPVLDREGRGMVERLSIALLSVRTGGRDMPSAGWLGRFAEAEKIRSSGLWNVNHVDDRYDPGDIDELARLIDAVPSGDRP
jgi:hypothetical protein